MTLVLPVAAGALQSADAVITLEPVTGKYGRMSFTARMLVQTRRILDLILLFALGAGFLGFG